MGLRTGGGQNGHLPSMEPGTKNQKCLVNLKEQLNSNQLI